MSKFVCNAKHTKIQFEESEWACPKCGETALGTRSEMGFIITELAEDAHEDCGLLHEKDYAICHACGAGFTGRQIAKGKKAKLTTLEKIDSLTNDGWTLTITASGKTERSAAHYGLFAHGLKTTINLREHCATSLETLIDHLWTEIAKLTKTK